MKYKNTIILILVLLCFIILSKLNFGQYIEDITAWFNGLGIFAPILYLVFFTCVSGIFIPVFILSLAAGYLFDIYLGTIIVSVGNLISALIMFYLARKFGGKWAQKNSQKYRTVKKLKKAIESEGWRMLFILRAVPVAHMILLNIACGMTKMKVKEYVFGTWLGMLPLLILYVYMGTVSESLMQSPKEFFASQSFWFWVPGSILIPTFIFYMNHVNKKYKNEINEG